MYLLVNIGSLLIVSLLIVEGGMFLFMFIF